MKGKGITLIEFILVIGVIAILTGIIVASQNPLGQLARNRNIQRRNDITEIAQVVHQFKIHHKNQFPKTNSNEEIKKCDETTSASDLSDSLTPDYLTVIPSDPNDQSDYLICQTEQGQIKVTAPKAELNQKISITR